MKKLFALLLAALLIVGMLPTTAMAEAPESIKITFRPAAKGTYFYKTLSDGDIAYAISAEKLLTNWTADEAPSDNFVKMEYVGGILKVTFQNFDIDATEAGGYNLNAIEFPSGEYSIAVELVGQNSMAHGKSASIKYKNDGGMTITGSGSMTLSQSASSSGALWCEGGDLLIKDTTMKFVVTPSDGAKYHAIFAATGSVTFENATIESQTNGGCLVFLGTTTAKSGRYTLDTENLDRKITIKDSNITASAKTEVFMSTNPATVSNTTMKLTLTNGNNQGPAFSPNPTIEGEYSAIAGLRKNAEKLEKLKEFNMKKLGSYTYIYMVPGKVDLLPTEATEAPTEAPTTEETVAPTTEATEPVDATQPTTADKNEATQPTTADKNEATQPANKDDNKTDNKTDNKGEEKSGSPLKVILIILIALVVLGGGAVAVILILRNKNAGEEEEEESEEETEE